MRIAYVSVDPGVSIFGPHGASVHIQEIVREFAAQGHEVTIFTTRRGPTWFTSGIRYSAR